MKNHKKDMQDLRQLAASLPRTYQDGEVMATITGAALIAKGINEVDGKPVLPEKSYLRKISDRQPVNHFRRMKKLYTNGGAEEVAKYCFGVKELHENSKLRLRNAVI